MAKNMRRKQISWVNFNIKLDKISTPVKRIELISIKMRERSPDADGEHNKIIKFIFK